MTLSDLFGPVAGREREVAYLAGQRIREHIAEAETVTERITAAKERGEFVALETCEEWADHHRIAADLLRERNALIEGIGKL